MPEDTETTSVALNVSPNVNRTESFAAMLLSYVTKCWFEIDAPSGRTLNRYVVAVPKLQTLMVEITAVVEAGTVYKDTVVVAAVACPNTR